MNKTLLIAIVDFILVSMLTLGRFDDPNNPERDQEKKKSPTVSQTAGATQPQQELMMVLQGSLLEEREERELLKQQLNDAAAALKARENDLASREKEMNETTQALKDREDEAKKLELARQALEKQLEAEKQNLATTQKKQSEVEQRAERLEKEKQLTESELAALAKKYQAAQTSAEQAQATAQKLESDLQSKSAEARVSQQVLDALQNDLRKQVEVANTLNGRVQQLEQTRQQTEAEKQQLASKLEVVQVEKQLTREQVENMRQEVQTVRQEKARLEQRTTELAANVSELADNSTKLTQEIRQTRPLPANAIFSQFQTNRIQITFQGTRPGVFGQTVHKDGRLETLLLSHNNQVFALFHISDTPLALEPFPTEWTSLTGTIGKDKTLYSITQLSFLNQDPRILMVPIGAPQAAKLNCRIYPVADDPSKFQEAVLIGATDGYYGECAFQIDPAAPQYVRMNRERFTLFSGKFNPSRGDLVVSKSGELLGIMANKEYCLLVNGVSASRSIRTGPAIEQPTQLLSQLYHQLISMPNRLQ